MRHIVKKRIESINQVLYPVTCANHGLMGGNLGLSYYYFHVGKILVKNDLYQKGAALLSAVIEDVNEEKDGLAGAFLSQGGAGLALVLSYLQQHEYVEYDIDEMLVHLDEYLAETAETALAADNTDYLHGAAGILHYFAERQQTPAVNSRLNKLADLLMSRAVHTERGVWFKNTFREEPARDEEINLSLAHGLSGILLILLNAYPHLNDKENAEKIIREGIRFILQYELPVDYEAGEYSCFPGFLGYDDTEIIRHERLGWCYGDLNIVLLLYRAGRLLGDARYTAVADRIGLMSTKRSTLEATRCKDTHFCHGAAGLAQFYKSLYAETYHYQYYIAYEHWINITTTMITKEIADNRYQHNPGGLLEGLAGVGLVLADYVADEKLPLARFFHL